MAIFQVDLGWLVLSELTDDGDGNDNWSYKTCKAAIKCHHQQTNNQFFTGRMPFLLPN